MAVMIMRAYTYVEAASQPGEAKASKASFRDADSVSGWAIEDVLAAQAEGLIMVPVITCSHLKKVQAASKWRPY